MRPPVKKEPSVWKEKPTPFRTETLSTFVLTFELHISNFISKMFVDLIQSYQKRISFYYPAGAPVLTEFKHSS